MISASGDSDDSKAPTPISLASCVARTATGTSGITY